MTATQFGIEVTAIIDQATKNEFIYLNSFERDCERLMQAQLTAEEAAEKIMSEEAE